MTASIGVELLSEQKYRKLQKLGSFDTKTSSWIKPRLKSKYLAAVFLLILATEKFLFITTVPNLTMLQEGSTDH